MRFVVLVRSAMASTRAPASPIAENSCVAMSRMLRLVSSGSYLRRPVSGVGERAALRPCFLFSFFCLRAASGNRF